MIALLRSPRFFWILGLVLLVATLAGGWALNHSPRSHGQSFAEKTQEKLPPGVHCIGFVDVEGGIPNLYPVLPGRVVKVLPEGVKVSKGQTLLWLDSRQAELKIIQAKQAWLVAKDKAAQADRLVDSHKLKLQQQEAGVSAAKAQLAVVQHELNIKTRLAAKNIISEDEKLAVEETWKKVAALANVEELKLKELALVDPALDVGAAKADETAKKAQLDEAQFALDECELKAPEDGVVLRVFTTPGEILGPNPKLPAVQFCPAKPFIVRAEVLQEWASQVEEGMPVEIEDDTFHGPKWQGRVKRVSDWFTHKRNILIEPFMVNDVRTLECLIEILPSSRPLRIGQRVRAIIRPSAA